MNTYILNQKSFVLILVSILIVTLGTQNISYAQEANPAITASVEEPLTEATLHGSIVTLTLTGGRFADREWDIRRELSVLGIDSVTIDDVERVSDTEVTIELEFAGNIDTDATLTFTVEAGAIAGYDGNALTATQPVPAVKESLAASIETPLTEATLHGSTITLTLTGRRFVGYSSDIGRALSVSGIDGVTVDWIDGVERVSSTVATVLLTFSGNIDTDTTLTLTVGPDAMIGGYDKPFTFQFPVTAVEESLDASTETPLTESILHGSTITLTLTGRQFNEDDYYIGRALSFSGIEGVAFERWNVDRVSDTVATVGLEFSGNIDEDATLTLTVGPNAIGYDKAFTVQIPVTAVEESMEALTETPLTEATLDGSIITLSITGRQFADSWDIGRALSVSGIEGVAFERWDVERVSDTVVTVPLRFYGNIDTDATLTLTIWPNAIIGGYDKAFTVQIPVTAVEESLDASTETPLTEATLDGSIITLSITGRQFNEDDYIRSALSFSGIEGITFERWDVDRVSETVVTVRLTFSGNIDEDTTLTLTVGPNAIGYDKAFTFQFPVTAVEESMEASTETPLTEATLPGSIITLTLTGRHFVDSYYMRDALSVSGIEGVTVNRYDIRRVNDTEATVELTFSGNIDIDATLTLTVGPNAIGYDKPFTFQFPVTAVEESIVISTEFPLTEATLDGSIITLTLTGRHFVGSYYMRDALSVSGIEGVTFERWDVVRVSDTKAEVRLTFSSNMDTDATLTFTVGADAIAGYDQGATTQFPVTAIQKSNATVSIAPSPVVSPDVGELLTFNLNITGGENVAGYQATVSFDGTALSLIEATNGDYLPADAFFLADRSYREVTLTANALAEAANGNGTLATLTFEALDFKASTLSLPEIYLVDVDGKRWEVTTRSAAVTEPPEPAAAIFGDINSDGVVNIQDLAIVNARFGQRGLNSADVNEDGLVDIVDLVLVAGAFDAAAAAPALYLQALELFTAADVHQWLTQAQGLHLTDATFQNGIRFLQQLLTLLTPKETRLLQNYPNPFNPETWIPYRLAEDAFVTLTIYDSSGRMIRTLDVGHREAASYESRAKAIHWNGRNEIGEQVASGVYFYHLSAGDYTATRKMLILK